MLIGIDFDNTLVRYDAVFLAAARERELVGAGFEGGKRDVRDAVRLLPDGEREWQRLQWHAYGPGMRGARLAEGADAFLRRCRREGCPVVIVSHKTEELRDAAMQWLHDREPYGIEAEHVHWEPTRAAKLERIAALGCTHFVDDLVEVLADPAFPRGVQRFLLADGVTWQQVEERIFGDIG